MNVGSSLLSFSSAPQEAMALFREAVQVTPELQEVLQWMAKAESHRAEMVRWGEFLLP